MPPPADAPTGLLVSVEGGDGVGKSSAVAVVAEVLARCHPRGAAPLVLREPGGTSLGESLRGLLLAPGAEVPTPQAEVLLMYAARAQLVATVIRPALQQGRTVLCDRYVDASHAYQGGGRGIPAAALEALGALATDGLLPQLTLLLDADPELALARIAGRPADRIEAEALAFHQRVRASYLARAAADPARFLVIDASRPAAQVAADIESRLATALRRWW